NALRTLGYDVTEYDITTDLVKLATDRPAVVLLGTHGGIGENGVLQGFLEALKVPYTGSGVLASALAMDKARAKVVMREAGVPAPAGLRLPVGDIPESEIEALLADLELPVVVKLNDSGSSFGVFICETLEEVQGAMQRLSTESGRATSSGILLETYLAGPEYTVGFFDDLCLGSIEVVPSTGFYDFEAKYQSTMTEYRFVEDQSLLDRLERLGRKAYDALGCRGVARVDLKAQGVEADSELMVIELNTIPGMTATSLVPKLAARRGMRFEEFVEWMLVSASFENEDV
ncbi:MAG: D-alanine--D-alanine ligase family protein, partial [Bradymonadaceae bacterium]